MGVAKRLAISSKRSHHVLISSGSCAARAAWNVTMVMGGPRALVLTARIVGSAMRSAVVQATAFALLAWPSECRTQMEHPPCPAGVAALLNITKYSELRCEGSRRRVSCRATMCIPASAYVFSSTLIFPTSANPLTRFRVRVTLVCVRAWALEVRQMVRSSFWLLLARSERDSGHSMGGKILSGSGVVEGRRIWSRSPCALGYSGLAMPDRARSAQCTAAVVPVSCWVTPRKS